MIFSFFWLLWPILYAIGAMGAGTALASDELTLVYIINILAGCILPFRGIWYLVLARRNKTHLRPEMLVQTVLEFLTVVLIVLLPKFSYNTFLVFLGLYFSFNTAVQGINAVIYGKNRVFQYFIPALCQCILFFHIFLGLFILPEDIRYRMVMGGTGYLLSVLGHFYLCDLLSVTVKNKKVAEIFRKISVTMPGFRGLGIPTRLLAILKNDDVPCEVDAEIIFNYGKHGKGVAGHCELCVGGYSYTYGNYDPHSRAILKTMGNGIVFRAEKQKYIDFLTSQGRTVVVYGLKFNEEQLKQFEENLSEFNNSLSPWMQETEKTAPEEYINQISSNLDADIYSINKGRFKTYFLPTINCVTLTGSLLKGTAAGNIVFPGVYTPGSYMDALHRLYVAGNDVVVSVNTYNI